MKSTAGVISCLILLLKVGAKMDDSGHRENGRHKADQYKSVHTQVSTHGSLDLHVVFTFYCFCKQCLCHINRENSKTLNVLCHCLHFYVLAVSTGHF